MVRIIDVSVPEHQEKPPPDQDPEYEVIACDEDGDGYDISEVVDALEGVTTNGSADHAHT